MDVLVPRCNFRRLAGDLASELWLLEVGVRLDLRVWRWLVPSSAGADDDREDDDHDDKER